MECPVNYRKRCVDNVYNLDNFGHMHEDESDTLTLLRKDFKRRKPGKLTRWSGDSLPYMYLNPKNKAPLSKSSFIQVGL